MLQFLGVKRARTSGEKEVDGEREKSRANLRLEIEAGCDRISDSSHDEPSPDVIEITEIDGKDNDSGGPNDSQEQPVDMLDATESERSRRMTVRQSPALTLSLEWA